MGKGAHQIYFLWRRNHLFPKMGFWERNGVTFIMGSMSGRCQSHCESTLHGWVDVLRSLVYVYQRPEVGTQGQRSPQLHWALLCRDRLKAVWFRPDIWDCAGPGFHSDTMWHQEVVGAADWSDLVLTSLEWECRTAPLDWVFLEGGRVHFAMSYLIID